MKANFFTFCVYRSTIIHPDDFEHEFFDSKHQMRHPLHLSASLLATRMEHIYCTRGAYVCVCVSLSDDHIYVLAMRFSSQYSCCFVCLFSSFLSLFLVPRFFVHPLCASISPVNFLQYLLFFRPFYSVLRNFGRNASDIPQKFVHAIAVCMHDVCNVGKAHTFLFLILFLSFAMHESMQPTRDTHTNHLRLFGILFV